MYNSRKLRLVGIVVALLWSLSVVGQSASVAALSANASAVPRLVSYSGVLKDAGGRTLTGITGVTFLLYKDQQGGAPVWLETQSVTPDRAGHYTVQLGAASAYGLPAEVFTSGEGRWLAVQVANEAEQARVLLVAVPYAIKAADAETVGGLPPSAFVLAAPAAAASSTSANANDPAAASSVASIPPPASTVTTSGGILNTIPLFTTATNIQSSGITQAGTGSTAKIGINTTTPAATLDVKGTETVRGTITLPASGAATATGGKDSQAERFVASSFSSSTSTAVNETFQLQAEPAANNTANPSGTLNLLYGLGATTPAETGLKINSKGQLTFVPGQTYPGAGTVKSVGLSAPASDFTVTGSPVTGNGTLGLAWNVAPTDSNTPNAIVKRDSSGSFAAQVINVGYRLNVSGDYAVTAGGTIWGVEGYSQTAGGMGVRGWENAGGIGVWGYNSQYAGGQAVVGQNDYQGAAGFGNFGPDGVDGVSSSSAGSGVAGFNSNGGDGVYGYAPSGSYAIYSYGDMHVNGTLSKAGGSFKIDHPLDPANKYLYHSFVESPDMMNIYNGNVTTDGQGNAAIQLPEWFETLNRDFRYQLTVIGQFAQAIVATKIANHRFTIKTDKPNVEVSWQVTGIRQDAWANAHRIPVEQAKPASERGRYLHPELYGAPVEQAIGAEHYPIVQRSEKERAARLAAAKSQ